LWVIEQEFLVAKIEERFKTIPKIYIADGHHRSASSALLGKDERKKQKSYTGVEAYNFYLGIFFAENHLKIYDYNRVVKDLNDLTSNQVIEKIKLNFGVEEIETTIFKPSKAHQFSMYLQKKWYALTAKQNCYDSLHPIGSLDASIFSEKILSPIFEIHDLKTDDRIGFVPGIKGAEELKKVVDEEKYVVAFGLFPVEMQHLKWIADTNNIMPPKSTWIEPKIRSGLVIYDFKE
jgi:uncharacterized protein (DUF1015 family)